MFLIKTDAWEGWWCTMFRPIRKDGKKTQQFKIWRLHDLKKQAITLLSHDRLNKSATLIFWQISYTHLDTCTHLSLVYSLSVKHATKTTPLKINLAGGFNPFEKYALVKLDHFPRDRGENKNIWVATTYGLNSLYWGNQLIPPLLGNPLCIQGYETTNK